MNQLESLIEQGTTLVRGRPDDSGSNVDFDHWILYQRPPPPGQSVGPMSSRLSRDKSQWKFWFDAIRTLVCRLESDQHYLVTADGTSTSRYATHLAKLFGVPTLHFYHWPTSRSFVDIASSGRKPGPATSAYVLTGRKSGGSLDEIIALYADEVRVLYLRSGGNIEKAVAKRLASRRPGRVFIGMQKSTAEIQKLLDHGAIGWWLFDLPGVAGSIKNAAANISPVPIIKLADFDDSEYLHHFTRPRGGPWPDQSESDYFNELLFGDPRSNHDILATLTRILVMKRLLASNQTTRSQHHVCSFTRVPLRQFASLRKFQSHLSRWDFLPFGISFRKTVLQQYGARPVIYGDDKQWKSLPAVDQPFFHPATTTTRSGKEIEWSAEREWRLIGDFEFSKIDPQACVVFVKDEQAAQTIRSATHFRIVVASQ